MIQSSPPLTRESCRASVVIIAFNDKQHLPDCLDALLVQNNAEVIIVDNASSDGSAELVETAYPHVRLVKAGRNLGFGGGNNLGASVAQGEYLVFLNSDTIADKNWLHPLLSVMERDPSIGLATVKLLLMHDPERINTCGNDVHFTGFGYLRAYGTCADTYTQDEEVCAISGAAFAIRKDLFHSLGGFDECFFPAYVEDTDLSWQVRLAGYRNVVVADSIVFHDYNTKFAPEKYYWLERNRWQLILKTFRLRTLTLMLPVLLLSEIMTWGFASLQGGKHLQAKLRMYGWIFRHMQSIRKSRKQRQSTRIASDRDLLNWCTPYLNFSQVSTGVLGSTASAIFNPLYALWYRFLLAVVRW
jgi:GT2 family glycosyltransferase